MAATDQAISGVAGRYASALFELATENKAVPKVQDGLSSFEKLLSNSADLQRLLRSPVFSADAQVGAIESLAPKAGVSGLALNFLKLMAKNRRLSAAPAAIAAFHALVAKSRGETTAEVTSAEALSAKQISDLKSSLKQVIGSDVALETKVDPAILGGLIVKVGSRMMDNSLRTKLNNLKTVMKGNA